MPDTPMTPDLDAIRERLEAITPGPWERCRAFNAEFVCRTDDPKESVGEAMIARLDRRGAKADAIFIAAAPTDVTALMAEVERLRSEAQRREDVVAELGRHLKAAITDADIERRRAHAEVTRLRPMEAALAAVRELHQPYGIYDECGHDHTEEDIKAGRAVFVEGDYYSCADGLMYWACTVCCTWRTKDGELYGQSEDCANGGYGHDHDKTDKPICPTRAALDGGA